MYTIQEILENPIMRGPNAADRARLELIFPGLHGLSVQYFLSLRPYAKNSPERFFNQNVYELMINWLKDRDDRQRDTLQEFFKTIDAELSRAFLFLRQINAENWHDIPIEQNDDYYRVQFIDKHFHPAYLRLIEGIFAPLIFPVAFFMRLDRCMGTEGLDVYNLVQELATTSMAPCVSIYHQIIRNGISHGGITYLQNEIRYRDKKGNEETLDVWSMIRLCDDLIDVCNGLSSALKVFLILSRDKGYKLPRELLIEELVEETRTPWWSIEGCVESILGSTRQLMIYAHPNSRDFAKVQWSSFQSAVLAEYFATGYDRYFFSLQTPLALPGWVGFNGNELKRLRESNATEIADYATTMEKPGVFYVPRFPLPRFLGVLDTLLHSFRLRWPLTAIEIRKNLGIPEIISRNASIHRNGWSLVLNGSVVIENSTKDNSANIIRTHRRQIIRKVAKQARTSTSLLNPIRYLPIGYARIAVFSKDFRQRRLNSFGLGPELICTIQLKYIHRIKSPDIMGSTIETKGNWRIAWNRAWIESGGLIGTRTKDAAPG